jgi:hypothetical protein
LAERLARHDQRTLGSMARQFASECLDFADAEDNRLEPREVVFASGLVHLIHSLLRTVHILVLIATENTGCQLPRQSNKADTDAEDAR